MKQTECWNADYYAKNSLIQLGHAKELLEQYQFRGNESILDIGCGDGKITASISTFIPKGEITGLDNSNNMLQHAEKNFTKKQFPNLDFVENNAVNMDYIDCFDLILSFSCLHYVKDQLTLLKNIKCALKENGKILLMLYRKCPAQWGAIDDVVNDAKWQSYFVDFDPGYYEYSPENFNKLLVKAGLDHFNARFTKTEYLKYDSPLHLMQFMRGWLPHIKHMPEDLADDFTMEVVEKYLNNLGIDSSRDAVLVPFVRLLVY